RPRLEPREGRVVEGYGILQPRIAPTLPTEREGSLFRRVFSGPAGIDPYSAAVSDVYQDLFGEGSYTGKGIYDVDAFERALEGRVPENTLLSHDLFEGLFARAALVTDIELFEDFPARYEVSAARQHRWARGDWQLLPRRVQARVPARSRREPGACRRADRARPHLPRPPGLAHGRRRDADVAPSGGDPPADARVGFSRAGEVQLDPRSGPHLPGDVGGPRAGARRGYGRRVLDRRDPAHRRDVRRPLVSLARGGSLDQPSGGDGAARAAERRRAAAHPGDGAEELALLRDVRDAGRQFAPAR